MANIVVSFFNSLIQLGDKNGCAPYYQAFLQGLRDSGNNVLCFQFLKQQVVNDERIPEEYLEKIKAFNPDIFIFFNNQFWLIQKEFNCPVYIYDVDSPTGYCNSNLIKDNINNYKFITQQTDGADMIIDSLGANKNNIKYIPPYTMIKAQQVEQSINIGFLGTNWAYTDFNSIINFISQAHSHEDKIVARRVYELFEKYPTMTSDEIYENFNLQANKKLKLDNLYYTACRVSGIKRLRYLENIADLGLEIRGLFWENNPVLATYPELLFSYSKEITTTIDKVAQFYNSTKLQLNTKHIQAKSGFSWRVADILATNACLVSEYASDIEKFGFKIPMFISLNEEREICEKLLKNENMRKDIVAHSQEIINKNHRFENVLPLFEDFMGMSLHSNNEGSLEIITIDNRIVKADDKMKILSKHFPIQYNRKSKFKEKILYKISNHFYKELKKQIEK